MSSLQKYQHLTWRGQIAESAQCLTCLRADGGHDEWCAPERFRPFGPTEQSELAWLNARLDTINAERDASGVEDLHWQEHRSICRSLRALIEAALADPGADEEEVARQPITI